ncbi:MAG: hypothetical protein HXY39_13860 [Chloroflexi bacterium]|nr:hypothetical protein [Chloroflexota bacterium]
MAQREPTIASILQELAVEYDDVVAEREIYQRVLDRRPSQARDPFASIRERLRFEAAEVGWVRMGDGTLLPLHVALTGLRFRITPGDDELAAGALLRTRLIPFVPMTRKDIVLTDAEGSTLPVAVTTITANDAMFGPFQLAALHPGPWMARMKIRRGDSILVTIERAAPLTLRLEHEPRAAFHLDEVLHQERELLDGIVARVAASRSRPLTADEAVLPVYARAPWRTAYPGRCWQDLVASDRRLRLIDGVLIGDHAYRRPIDDLIDGMHDARAWEERDTELLAAIAGIQHELLESRREAATQELWNGVAPRISTARVVFDSQSGESTVIQPEPIDALCDYTDQIEERLRNGGYDDDAWDMLEDEDPLFGTLDLDHEELAEVPLIEDLRGFIAERPELAAAARRLMAALSAEDFERLQHAQSSTDVQNVLAARFHRILPDNPDLFATLVRYTAPTASAPDFAGGPPELEDSTGDSESPFTSEPWEADEDEEWDDDIDDQPTVHDEALTASHELMERFYAYLIAQGKSEATAASRTGDLWIYADFLASYYAQTLAEGNYTTLDECLFFFYPRRVANSSPRGARELCTSLKQFYSFLRMEQIADDRFAREMWRRRDQVARVVDLYDQIDVESPQFERLFVRLFAPYTA